MPVVTANNFNDSTPAAPATGTKNVHWQASAPGTNPRNVSANYDSSYDVVASFIGQPTNAALVFILTFTRNVSFQANWAGSEGTVGTNPTATATYTIFKNGTSIGTIVISPAGAFTFASSGGAAFSFVAGDRLTITAPSPADASLANIGITLAGWRT
jgi:hypothetical protein